ncbi:MAG: sulfatase-like hydrolase/transferase, partial [Nocardioides sp.]
MLVDSAGRLRLLPTRAAGDSAVANSNWCRDRGGLPRRTTFLRAAGRLRAGVALLVGLLAVAVGSGLAALPITVAPQAGVMSGRPNVVLITTDDQAAADLAWMAKTRAAIGDAGVTFRQGISPHPLCCPARAEMLTGQYAQNNGVYTNKG